MAFVSFQNVSKVYKTGEVTIEALHDVNLCRLPDAITYNIEIPSVPCRHYVASALDGQYCYSAKATGKTVYKQAKDAF